MPVRYQLDGRIVRLCLEGRYEPDDVITTFDRAAADPALPADVRLLIDVRASEVLGTHATSELRRIAEAFVPRAHRVGGRCAVVAGSEFQYGLMRMASVFAEAPGVEAEVFFADADAIAWLEGT